MSRVGDHAELLTFRFLGRRLRFVWRRDATGHRPAFRFVDEQHARQFLDALVQSGEWWGMLQWLCHTTPHLDAVDATCGTELVSLIAQHLARRTLLVVDAQQRARPGITPGRVPGKTVPPPPSRPPERETTFFDLRILDDVGVPIDGITVHLAVAGAVHRLTTNGDGRVHLGDVDAGVATANIPNVTELRDKLRPRWQTPRQPAHPVGPNVVIQRLNEAIEAIHLENEVLETLVILPRFACRELRGTAFRYGRSFVSRSGLATLRDVARVVTDPADGRKAAVFGHTDEVDTLQRAKELSERRAEAVYALLTHDAARWEKLWSGTADAAWRERWGTREGQHMLNALDVAVEGSALEEDGILGPRTKAAIRLFQSGAYPRRPPEQAPIDPNGELDVATRKELFLAYAKLAVPTAAATDRIVPVGDGAFMGCGSFNPLKPSGLDAESGRVVALIFDPAAQPVALPCRLRQLAPCHAASGTPPEPGAAPYRCSVYRDVAQRCPCSPGGDLMHDLVVVLPFTTEFLAHRRESVVVESEDGTIVHERRLATDAVPEASGRSSVRFRHLPDVHAYRLRCEHGELPHEVFVLTPYEDLSDLSAGEYPDGKRPTVGQV